MSLTRKVALNTIFQIVGKIIVTGLSLVVIGFLTRYLGVEGYGAYTTIFAYVSFWAVLADFGFFWVLVRELSKPGADQSKVFDNVITLKFLFGLVVFVLCSIIGFFIPQYSWTIKMGIAIISASWFWMSLNGTYVGFFQSRLEMYKSVISEIVGRLLIFGGVLWLIRLGSNLEGILAVYIIGNFGNFLLSFIFGSYYIKFRPAFDWYYWKIILSESLPLALLSFIGLIHFKIDTIILSLMKGVTDVGIYGVPYKILEIIILLPAIFMGNVFPILTKYYHDHDKRLAGSIQKAFDFLIILAFPIVTGLIILAKPIINFIAGADYLVASTVSFANHDITAPIILMILAVSIGFSFILTIFSSLLTVIGKQRSQVMPMVIITVVNVGLNIWLIPRYSYFAASVVNCITNFMMLIWWNALTHRYLGFRLRYKLVLKVFFSTLIMGFFLYIFRSYNILISVSIGVVVFSLACYLTKVFNKDLIMQILPKVNKEK